MALPEQTRRNLVKLICHYTDPYDKAIKEYFEIRDKLRAINAANSDGLVWGKEKKMKPKGDYAILYNLLIEKEKILKELAGL